MTGSIDMDYLLEVIVENKPDQLHLDRFEIEPRGDGGDDVVLCFTVDRVNARVYRRLVDQTQRQIGEAFALSFPDAKRGLRFVFDSIEERRLRSLPKADVHEWWRKQSSDRPGTCEWWCKQGLSGRASRRLCDAEGELSKDVLTRDDILEHFEEVLTPGTNCGPKTIEEIRKFFDIDFIIPPP